MIIACYAGVGKSTFASMYPEETLDLFSMPYKWILPEKDGKEGEFENVKAVPYLLLNPAFPESYLRVVLEKEAQYRYVLIPTIPSVLRMLREDCGIPYILCYPQISLRAEYEKRYRQRGNSDSIMDIFIEQWDERISSLMEDTYGKFALGKDFYESGNQDKVCHICIDEVQMLEKFYDHQYGSDPHYIQKAESRESVMKLLFGGEKR